MPQAAVSTASRARPRHDSLAVVPVFPEPETRLADLSWQIACLDDTRLRSLQTSGQAEAEAEAYAGTVQVFVEDSRAV